MSKYLKILVAALAAVALATPAVAITLDAKGLFLVRAIMSDNVSDAQDESGGANDDARDGFDQRFRLMTTAALNDAVKMVVEIESDYAWGQNEGALRADKKGELELRTAYLDFTTNDANFKVGTQTFNLGSGFIINEQATGINMKYRGLGLSFIKVVENSYTSSNNDRDYFGASYAIKAGDFTITPEVGYLNANNLDTGTDVYIFGAGAKGKVDNLNLEASLLFSSWDADTLNARGNDDGMGTAAYAKAVYVDGPTSFGLTVAYVGDEDAAGGEFVDVDGFQNWSELLTGGEFGSIGAVGHAYLDGKFPDDRSATGTSPGYYYSNYMYVKLNAGTRIFNEKSGIRAAYIYAQQAADPAEGVDAVTFGHEIDAYFDYAITKGLKWTTGGGYLLADDDLSATNDADNMWKLGTKLTYVF